MDDLSLTLHCDGSVGPQLGVGTQHLIDAWVGHRERGQSERSGADVHKRPAGVAGENRLVSPLPGDHGGLPHRPASSLYVLGRNQRQRHGAPGYGGVDGRPDLHATRSQKTWQKENNFKETP